MIEQKQIIIRRFRKEAKKRDKIMREVGITCACGKCNLAKFSLKDIEEIINWKDKDELKVKKEKKQNG